MKEATTGDAEKEAAAWAIKLDRASADPAVNHALERWLSQDPKHAGALLRAQAALTLVAGDRIATPGRITSQPPPQREGWGSAKITRRAAIVGFGAALGAGFLFWRPAGEQVATAIGETRRLPLRDGSIVTLDSSTVLQIAVSETRRRVEMLKGRSLFQIAGQAPQAFLVKAMDFEVRAVQAVFQIDLNEALDLLVAEGQVELNGATGSRRLRAPQRLRVATSGEFRIHDPDAAEISRALSWREGRLVFSGETLAEAVKAFNRANPRPVIVSDTELAAKPIYGAFRTDDAAAFARAIGLSFGAPVREEGGQIVIGR